MTDSLKALYNEEKQAGSEAVDVAIQHAFVALDNEFVHEAAEKALAGSSRAEAARLLSPAIAGSCAILAFYDHDASQVKVALTGDSRAVRGRKNHSGKWEFLVLSVDQTGDNEEEAERIRKEHPDEPDVVKDGRVLGWQPTRLFGDAGLKWSVSIQDQIWRRFLGKQPRDTIKTPPYVSAEPVITTTEVKEGDFLIMASDGIWECLSNEEAVELVGAWVDGRKGPLTNIGQATSGPTWFSRIWPWESQSSKPNESNYKDGTVRYQQWQIPKRFVNIDDNSATHLFRNCLGGENQETMKALLTRSGYLSRRLR